MVPVAVRGPSLYEGLCGDNHLRRYTCTGCPPASEEAASTFETRSVFVYDDRCWCRNDEIETAGKKTPFHFFPGYISGWGALSLRREGSFDSRLL